MFVIESVHAISPLRILTFELALNTSLANKAQNSKRERICVRSHPVNAIVLRRKILGPGFFPLPNPVPTRQVLRRASP